MKHLFLTSSMDTENVAASVYKRAHFSKSPHTAFILTPIEAEVAIGLKTWEGEERVAMQKAGFDTFDYTITNKQYTQIKSDLSNIDVLYISGVNEQYFREKCDEQTLKDLYINSLIMVVFT